MFSEFRKGGNYIIFYFCFIVYLEFVIICGIKYVFNIGICGWIKEGISI